MLVQVAIALPQIITNRVESKHGKCSFPLDSSKIAIMQGIS